MMSAIVLMIKSAISDSNTKVMKKFKRKRLIPKTIMPKNSDFTMGDSILMPCPRNKYKTPIQIPDATAHIIVPNGLVVKEE